MTSAVDIHGQVEPGFEGVRDAFAENFRRGEEIGAGFFGVRNGEAVADIWGGHSDKSRQVPWTENTLTAIFSSGKAAIAFLIARAVSNGRLDYESPVARYWPEFAAHGKDAITIAEALSHQAGLCGFPEEMPPKDWLDWDLICRRIAEMKPLWAPGTAFGYHPQTVGFIAGEILRRVDGRTIGAILREDFGSADLHCGLGEAELSHAATMTKPPRAPELGELNRFKEIAFLKPWSAPARVAREDWAAAEIPASNMHATARALATVLHPMANGGQSVDGARAVDKATIEAALSPRVSGDDLVLPFHLTWAAGLMKNSDGHLGPSATACGHYGSGGSCVIVDPRRGVSAAYVMNKMSPHLVGDPRAVRLLDALYACL